MDFELATYKVHLYLSICFENVCSMNPLLHDGNEEDLHPA